MQIEAKWTRLNDDGYWLSERVSVEGTWWIFRVFGDLADRLGAFRIEVDGWRDGEGGPLRRVERENLELANAVVESLRDYYKLDRIPDDIAFRAERADDKARAAVLAEIRAVAEEKAQEKRIELWKLARRELSKLAEWPKCKEHDKALTVFSVTDLGAFIVCGDGCETSRYHKFPIPTRLAGVDAYRVYIPIALGGSKK